MAGPWNLTPNRNLQFAGALAGGVQNFMTAYQGQQNKNREFEIRENEMRAQTELRKLQVEKLRQEMAPVEFSLQKFQTIDNAFGAGIVPEKLKNDAAREVIEAADTPQKLKFLNQVIDRKKSSDLRAMSTSPGFAEQFGSGAVVPEIPEMPEASAAPAPAPASMPPSGLKLSPKEADFYGGLIKSKYATQAQFSGIQQRDAASERNLQAALKNYDTRLEAAKDSNETKAIIQELRNELGRFQTTENNEGRMNVQNLRNEGSYNTQKWKNRGSFDLQDMRNKGAIAVQEERNKGAAARASRSGKSASPESKLLERQIVETQKAINGLYKPATGISMETPRELQIKEQGLRNQLNQLQSAYKTSTGFDFNAAVQKGSGQAPANASAPKTVPQGNARPTFSKGPGVSAKIKALPDGTELEIDGAVFLKQGGQLLPR
jgi:uncharacterized protein YnzC (UPF0291/DUF896 family)